MRETNLMRKPFPWPRFIPITHSSSTLSQKWLVHSAGQCSAEAVRPTATPTKNVQKKAYAAQCFLLLLLIF